MNEELCFACEYKTCDCDRDDEWFDWFNCENCGEEFCIEYVHWSTPDEMIELCGECFHALYGH